MTDGPAARLALALAVVAGLGGPALAHDYELGALTIEHPWSRATPPGLDLGVGYLVVKNAGPEADRLIAAETPAAARVELHTHVKEGDVMRMRPVEAYDVPAGGTLSLAPGGDHLMLMDLTAPLAAGDLVPVTLVFEKAGRIEVKLMVEAPGSRPAGNQGHHHGH